MFVAAVTAATNAARPKFNLDGSPFVPFGTNKTPWVAAATKTAAPATDEYDDDGGYTNDMFQSNPGVA